MRDCARSSSWRKRLTAERYGRRAAALPDSKIMKLVAITVARKAENRSKESFACLCHWSLWSHSASRPTVSRNTVMAGGHHAGRQHRSRQRHIVPTGQRKWTRGSQCGLSTEELGVARIQLHTAPAVPPFQAVETCPSQRPHGLSCSPFYDTSFDLRVNVEFWRGRTGRLVSVEWAIFTRF